MAVGVGVGVNVLAGLGGKTVPVNAGVVVGEGVAVLVGLEVVVEVAVGVAVAVGVKVGVGVGLELPHGPIVKSTTEMTIPLGLTDFAVTVCTS